MSKKYNWIYTPCNHPGCLSHVTHPCEGCGRIGGKPDIVIDEANGTDYGCKVYGCMHQGKLFIDDIEYLEPVPEIEERTEKINELIRQVQERMNQQLYDTILYGTGCKEVSGFPPVSVHIPFKKLFDDLG